MIVESGHGWELRLGDFREVLRDVKCDALITDPPYLGACAKAGGKWAPGCTHRGDGSPMGYAPATEELLIDLCEFSATSSHCWIVVFNDFDGTIVIHRELKKRKLVTASPIAWIKPPSLTPPRGSIWLPEKGTEFIVCSRNRRENANGRYLPGSYISPKSTPFGAISQFVTGGKPIGLMLEIVNDYSEAGDLVCDPFCGGGTTALACLMSGRRFIGSEVSEENFSISINRLRNWEKGISSKTPRKSNKDQLCLWDAPS